MSELRCPWCMEPYGGDGYCTSCGRLPADYVAATNHLRPGTVLRDHYVVGRALRAQALGVTYLGYDETLGRRVSILEYLPVGCSMRHIETLYVIGADEPNMARSFEEGKALFVAQARALADIDGGGGLPRVADFFEHGGTAYLVLDYVEGPTLREEIERRDGAVAYQEALAFLEPVMSALERLHDKGFVHGGVSVDAIVSTKSGAVLADIPGVHALMDTENRGQTVAVRLVDDSSATQQGPLSQLERQVDVYGVATTLYFALTGVEPPDVRTRVVSDVMQTPTELGVEIGEQAEAVLLAGLSPMPSRRPETIKDLKRGLYANMGQTVTTTKVMELAAQQEGEVNFGRRKRSVPPLVIVLVVVALAAVGGFLALGSNGGGGDDAKVVVTPAQKVDVDVAVGMHHIALRRKDGSTTAVGNDMFGQCDIRSWDDVVSVAAGDLHTLGLRADGTVKAKGRSRDGQLDVDSWADVTSIAAGSMHSVAALRDGSVVACGDNEYGQCDVGAWEDVVEVAAGGWHTLGLRRNGTVVGVGRNEDGRRDVDGWKSIIGIDAGYWHSVGVHADGTCVAMGENHYGQCDVGAWTDVVSIVAGAAHTVGLRSDGTCVACGMNEQGQCAVSDWTGVKAVYAGGMCTIALLSDGSFVTAGADDAVASELESWNEKKTKADEGTWAALPLTTVDAMQSTIACGASFSARVTADGGVQVVGALDGQDEVERWKDVFSIVASNDYLLGLGADGKVYAAGRNDRGQCDVGAFDDVRALCAGTAHTVGVRGDGTVVACGDNSLGQCDVSTWTDVVYACASSTHTLGLKSDGTVVACGSNDQGQLDVTAWSDIVAIAAGEGHSVGLKSDGTVVACGSNDQGQLDVTTWTRITDIGAASAQTLGLKDDGTMVACGNNDQGQIDVSDWHDVRGFGVGLSEEFTYAIEVGGVLEFTGTDASRAKLRGTEEVVAVTSNSGHLVAQLFDGSYVAAGANDKGQCEVDGWNG